jgi:hypothetical protein
VFCIVFFEKKSAQALHKTERKHLFEGMLLSTSSQGYAQSHLHMLQC